MYKYGWNHSKAYQDKIISMYDSAQEHILKNFAQMDLENADLYEEYRSIVEEMIRDIEREKEYIRRYNFKIYNGYE